MSFTSSSVCNLCGRGEQLFRCSRCRKAVYCSKEHQREHWKLHRLVCIIPESRRRKGEVNNITIHQNSTADEEFVICPAETSQSDVLSSTSSTSSSRPHANNELEDDNFNNLHQECAQGEIAGSILNSRYKISPKRENFEEKFLDMGSVNLTSECSLKPETKWQSSFEDDSVKEPTSPPFLHRSFNIDLSCKEQLRRSSMEWLTQICQYVVRDLEKYGICVVDNFMGKERAESIHRSVVSMYHSGIFVEGETVSSSLETTKNVRSDKIAWVDGTEKNCADVAFLISTVDTVIMNAIRMKGNGQLGQRTISGRTKAMIACYPGSGSHYVKHVDNPNRDGRCITSTYYANKDWDAKTVGGLLRIFPQGWANQVVDIEPILDRMVFFWSDRRNPHEVQPSFRTRYAITVWYFDAKEREEARLRYNRECGLKNNLKSKE